PASRRTWTERVEHRFYLSPGIQFGARSQELSLSFAHADVAQGMLVSDRSHSRTREGSGSDSTSWDLNGRPQRFTGSSSCPGRPGWASAGRWDSRSQPDTEEAVEAAMASAS